jgi:SSS family solute:Na+ symporter
MVILAIFGAVLIIIGALDSKNVKNFDDYVLAGKSRRFVIVGSSMLASVVGASATLGVVKLSYNVGFPAFWWLGSGAIGLVATGIFIAGKLKNYDARTLADLLGIKAGKNARLVVSAIVVIGWTGIVAAQYVAAAKIVSAIGEVDYTTGLILSATFITAYCTLGGQASVLKTDFLQLIIMICGIGLTLYFLFSRTGYPESGIEISLVNENFPALNVSYFLIVVGSGFLVGPDVFGRLFTAKSGRDASIASIWSGIALAVVSVGIVMIGIWARTFIIVPEGQDVLPYILTNNLPEWFGFALSLGLLSAIISSADTCLITASSTLEHDIINKEQVFGTRVFTVVLGLVSAMIAWYKADIIGTLILAYSIFNCGAIPPVAVGILAGKGRKLNGTLVIFAMIIGGGLGVTSQLTGEKYLAIIGMAASILISIAALKVNKKNTGK